MLPSEKLQQLVRRYGEIDEQLCRPDVLSDRAQTSKLNKERSDLEPLVGALSRYRELEKKIRDDEEAIRIAHRLAENFAQEASIRDHERRLPLKELDEFSQSGLWGINVPKAYGGAEVSYVTVAEVIKMQQNVLKATEKARESRTQEVFDDKP